MFIFTTPCAVVSTCAMSERCSLHAPGAVITPWSSYWRCTGLHSSHRSPPHSCLTGSAGFIRHRMMMVAPASVDQASRRAMRANSADQDVALRLKSPDWMPAQSPATRTCRLHDHGQRECAAAHWVRDCRNTTDRGRFSGSSACLVANDSLDPAFMVSGFDRPSSAVSS